LTVYIDLENIDANTRSILLRDLELEFFPNDNNLTRYYNIIYTENIDKGDIQGRPNYDPVTVKGVELNDNLEHINDIKHKIRDIILRNSIAEYVVTRDRNSTNTINLMKRTSGESMGIFHCRHCAMEFDDEIQLSCHLRMHFFI
jgi:hypothetical protein